MGIQPKGAKEGKLRPQQSEDPALAPAALDLTPSFLVNFQVTLKEELLQRLQPRVPTTGELAHPVPRLGGGG